MENIKKCSKCEKVKSVEFFSKDGTRKDGLRSYCKECVKQHKLTNKEQIAEYSNQYRKANKEQIAEINKQYYEANKEKLAEYKKTYGKQYYLVNKETIVKKTNQYQKNRLATDSIFKFKCNVRSLIRGSFKRTNHKKATKTESILGCSLDFFKTYISNQFAKGMTLDNHGLWELDHIIPLASAKNEQDVIRLNHYTNFQPLWQNDNRVKSAKIIPKQLALI
jgi:hypothetical protein